MTTHNDQPRPFRHLDLFSGIGGFALAAGWAGWQTVGFSEIDEYANKVLAKHWPDVKNYGNIKNISRVECDVITGGFPCQPFSVAGRQKAQADDRHLWPEMLRVVKQCRPSWVIAENVHGLIRLGLDNVQSDLEVEGYTSRAIVVPACAVGANHRRERVWILAHTPRDGCYGGPTTGGDEEADDHCPEGEDEDRHDEGRGGLRPGLDRGGDPAGEWGVEPPAPRVDDGLPDRMDRNKAVGNAIVPQVAYKIMEMINSTLDRV